MSDETKVDYEKSFEKMRQKLRDGELDELKIEIEIAQNSSDLGDSSLPPEMIKVQESFIKILGSGQSPIKKEMKVKDAKEALKSEASEKLLDMEAVKSEARDRAQNGGIIFIDEIDKIAVSASMSHRSDPSKEGVQRDLLPIV